MYTYRLCTLSEKRIMCPAPCDFQVSSQVIILDKDSVWRYVDTSELPKCYKDWAVTEILWLILVDPMSFHILQWQVLYPQNWRWQELPAAQQSDALRLALLAKYGGVWALTITMVDNLRMMWRGFGQNAENHLTLHEHSANNLCLYFSDPFASLQHL